MCGVHGVTNQTMAQTIESASSTWRNWRLLCQGLLCASLMLCGAIIAEPSLATTAQWDNPSDPTIIGYRLYRAEGSCALSGFFTLVAMYGNVTSGEVPNPPEGGTHCHFLVAYDGVGDSLNSNYTEFTYPIVPQCPDVKYCRTLKGQARKQCLACR